MNFLNRKMFQNGGSVTYADGQTQSFDVNTFEQTINALTDSELFALRNSSQEGIITFSPNLQSILENAAARKEVPSASFISTGLGDMQSYGSLYESLPKSVEATYRPILAGLQRVFRSKEDLETNPRLIADQQYDSPLFGGGTEGFKDALTAGFRSPEQLKNILIQADITDFSEEIAEINEQPIEPAPEEISDVIEPNITAGLPEQLPTLTPITSGESAGQLFEPGTVGRAEQDARRLAYEKSIIGKDEFGFSLPEGRLYARS